MRTPFISSVLLFTAISAAIHAETLQTMTVDAGKFDRVQTIVFFEMPAGHDGAVRLRGDDGSTLPAQITGTHGSFILDSLQAGKTRTYRIEPSESRAGISMISRDTNVSFSSDGHDILRYNGKKTPLPEGCGPHSSARRIYPPGLHALREAADR